MGLLAKILQPLRRAVEGEYRPGPYFLPISGGWLPADVGSYWNWWQKGHNPQGFSPSAMVEACVSAYSQTTAMCPGSHWLSQDNGGRERITTSALSRILRSPNNYQTISDFMLNATRFLYTNGNAYALALRNSRYEISELHLMNPTVSRGMVAENGEVFYSLGGNQVIDRILIDEPLLVPARDVLHIRLQTPHWNILLGESPLVSALRDIAVTDAILSQQIQFYLNQARPSSVLSTDMVLDQTQVEQLRQRWNDQSKGMGVGGTPILTAGLKPLTMSTNPIDAQLAEVLKASEQHIALAYRIPLQILGIGGSTFGSTEALMQSWIASGLGFCLNHIEEAFGRLFELDGGLDEYVEFDTSALLRSAMKDRIDALARAVQGGIYSPNEARRQEDLPDVKFGDEPRVQQQVVPLSAAGAIPAAPAPNAAPPAAPVPVTVPTSRGEHEFDPISLVRNFRTHASRNISL